MRQVSVTAAAVLLLALVGCTDDSDTASADDQQASLEEDGTGQDGGGDAPADPGADPGADEGSEGDAGPEPEGDPDPESVDPLQGLALELVADGLHQPLDIAVVPGSDAFLVAQRTGDVLLVEEGGPADEVFLSLGGVVNDRSIEQGLLGVAPHPQYPEDPRVFVFHSLSNDNNVLVSYATDPGTGRADPDSREILLTVEKEPGKVRHNGGRLVFGPAGHLHAALGDAARASVNGQDPSTLPGSILRIDVDGGDPYVIPPDNPFADGIGGAPEVWWYGLRNPWQFTIDEPSGLAYIADVGQETIEEVNVVPYDEGGLNFGWPSFEGSEVFYSDDPVSEVTFPVLEVRHDDEGQGCSITGGPVYRGSAIPELDGHYFYADWCHGWIRSFRHDAGRAVDVTDWSEDLVAEMVSGFGIDADGELLVVDWGAGSVSRVVPIR